MRLNVIEHLFIVFESLSLFFVFAFEAWTLHFPLLESYFQIFVDTNNFIFFIFLWKVCSSMPFCKICESPAFLMYTFFKIFVFVSKFSIFLCFHTKTVHDTVFRFAHAHYLGGQKIPRVTQLYILKLWREFSRAAMFATSLSFRACFIYGLISQA